MACPIVLGNHQPPCLPMQISQSKHPEMAEIRVSQNLVKLTGKAHKMSGIGGGGRERTGVNCVTGEDGFQHWL